MKSFYGRDKVRITPVTKNSTTGEVVEGVSKVIGATVEDISSIRKVESKRQVDYDYYILIREELDFDIYDGYFIEVIEQFGKAITPVMIKKILVQQASRMGGLRQNCWEVFA